MRSTEGDASRGYIEVPPISSTQDDVLPVIIAVDDDAGVLGAVLRDLRRQYGERFRVHGADSGFAALEILRDLRVRGRCVALVLADQRMPGMTGLELLGDTAELHPGAKRVLLTAYSDNDVAIQGINEIRLDHFLMKPWDPPEEGLFPVLDDLLGDWQATARPELPRLRVVGHAWSPDDHRIRDFLSRNLVPFSWIDADQDPEADRLLRAAGVDRASLPLVVLPDGSRLQRPTTFEIGSRIGLQTRARSTVYDLIIVGAGPAGLAAAVYGASEGLSTLLIERDAPGGQAGRSKSIENYLGFPVGLSGGDLARRAVAQARRFGTEILTPVEAREIRSHAGYHTITLSTGVEVTGRSLLLSAGVSYRLLTVPGAERLTGRGIYYGAAAGESRAIRDRDIVVLGGGNSAGQAAIYLSGFARSVTLIVRRPALQGTMSHYLISQVHGRDNIRLRLATDLTGVTGSDRLETLMLRDLASGTEEPLHTDALFVFIGATAHTDWLPDEIRRDGQGFILSGNQLTAENDGGREWPLAREPLWLETSVPGIFVAGDVRHRSSKGVASAVGEGAMATQLIRQYLGGAPLRRVPARPTRDHSRPRRVRLAGEVA